MVSFELINKIVDKYPEIGECFLENSLIDTALLAMSFLEVKQLLKNFTAKERCDVWQIIQHHEQMKYNEAFGDTPPHLSPLTVSKSPTISNPVSVTPKSILNPLIETPTRLNNSPLSETVISRNNLVAKQDSENAEDAPKVEIRTPCFTVYREAELINTEKAGGLNHSQVSRLVRATITNMEAEIFPYKRKLTNIEIEEMAKSLVIVYPSLKDVKGTHLEIARKLTKRVYNQSAKKNSHKEFTDSKAKRRKKILETVDTSDEIIHNSKRIKFELTKSYENANPNAGKNDCLNSNKEPAEPEIGKFENANPNAGKNDCLNSNKEPAEPAIGKFENANPNAGKNDCLNSNKQPAEPEIGKFGELLNKESQKKNPNQQVLRLYLDKTFQERRRFLNGLQGANRIKRFMEKYPCFKKDHVHIIEEVLRIEKHQQNATDSNKDVFIQNLRENLDYIIYYGLTKHKIKPPSSATIVGKLVHMMENLHVIFSALKAGQKDKKKKRITRMFLEVEAHEDPDQKLTKISSNCPVLLLEEQTSTLVIGKSIIVQISNDLMEEVILTYLASFYLLDLDYPKDFEVCLTVLQWLIFNDFNAPIDVLPVANDIHQDFCEFKNA